MELGRSLEVPKLQQRGKNTSTTNATPKVANSRKGKRTAKEHPTMMTDNNESSEGEIFNDSEYEFSEEEEDIMKKVGDASEVWADVTRQFKPAPKNSMNLNGNDKDAEDSDNSMEESDHNSSEDFQSNASSENDDSRQLRDQFMRFRAATDMEDPQFKLGLMFSTKAEFKKACKSHAVKWGRKIRFKKNDEKRVQVICKDCDWYIWASLMNDKATFQIKSLKNKHTCGRTFNHGMATASFLSDKYIEDIRVNPQYKIGDFVNKVYKDLNVKITRNTAYRTKQMSRRVIEGSYTEQYSRLWDYCEELKKSNPGSNVFMTTTEDDNGNNQFQRIYVCLSACRDGFLNGCRPVVGLDGCHLRGFHKGILLSAVGIDPNNQLFPIVYAVVEVENKETWTWFVNELIEDFQITNTSKWTFITDKQKGLIQAIRDQLPGVEHRMCVRHMYNNFKKQHSGLALKNRIWAVARASYINKFVAEMESLKEFNEEAYKWLVEHTNPKEWSRAHFRTTPRCDILLNNLCESFNSTILEAREKPILGRKWDLNGIPCAHAVSAISVSGEDHNKFVDNYYSKEYYLKAYEPVIYPMNGQTLWTNVDEPPVLPPESIKLPGRPKKVRRREPDELVAQKKNSKTVQRLSRVGKMVYKCRRCRVIGHTFKNCPDKSSLVDENTETGSDAHVETNEVIPNVEPDVISVDQGNASAEPPMESQQIESQNLESHQAMTSKPLSVKNCRKYRCSVCLKYGHNRSKCQSTVADLFRTFDNGLIHKVVNRNKCKSRSTNAPEIGERS